MLARIVIAFFLLTGISVAQKDGMTTLSNYRSATYRLLSLDTAGPGHINIAVMNQFIYRSVDQMPAWVHGSELSKVDSIVGTVNVLYVDTLVSRILSVAMIDSGFVRPLKQRQVHVFEEEFRTMAREGERTEFLEFSYFADTIYLYPTRSVTGSDTLRILYYQQPVFAADTTITIARSFQMGVVFYATYLSELRLMRGREDVAWKRYTDWVASAQANLVRKFVGPNVR